jgi:hypothetical protein
MMKQTLFKDNVRSFFMQLGLTYDIDTIPYVLIFDEHVPRQSPGPNTAIKRRSEEARRPKQNAET